MILSHSIKPEGVIIDFHWSDNELVIRNEVGILASFSPNCSENWRLDTQSVDILSYSYNNDSLTIVQRNGCINLWDPKKQIQKAKTELKCSIDCCIFSDDKTLLLCCSGRNSSVQYQLIENSSLELKEQNTISNSIYENNSFHLEKVVFLDSSNSVLLSGLEVLELTDHGFVYNTIYSTVFYQFSLSNPQLQQTHNIDSVEENELADEYIRTSEIFSIPDSSSFIYLHNKEENVIEVWERKPMENEDFHRAPVHILYGNSQITLFEQMSLNWLCIGMEEELYLIDISQLEKYEMKSSSIEVIAHNNYRHSVPVKMVQANILQNVALLDINNTVFLGKTDCN